MRRMTFSGGYGITTGAISGIDIALWDVAAKRVRQPLVQLLGGSPHKVRRYASLSRYSKTDDLGRAVGWLLERGYTSIKVHQSSRDALEAIRLVREQYGNDFELTADLNCAFGFGAAENFMKLVQRYELLWVEEPLWPPDDFDSLKKLNSIGPVAAGENFFSIHEFKRLMDIGALTYYQPDVAKMGGVTPALEFLYLAKVYGVNVAFHNRPHNGWVGTVASAHIASALAPEAMIETPPNEIPRSFFSFEGGIDKTGIEPAGMGLGIVPLDSIPTSEASKFLRFHEN
jgi:L-alanine-DL-glutamate epimerase-like enolase superfamily enzyme